jgi:hypothetical protein
MIKISTGCISLILLLTLNLHSEECKTTDSKALNCLEGVAEKLQSDNIIDSTGICKYSWSEKPGYADYTMHDKYSKTSVPSKHGRSQANSLIGNKTLPKDLCKRTKALMSCFEKVFEGNDPQMKAFLNWAKKLRYDPIRIMLALSYQETKSGQIEDKCYGKNCNGIGLMQIITAIGKDGKIISNSSPEWKGITHNVKTNIEYSIRVLSSKVKSLGPSTLYDLARDYNGSGTKHKYAKAVTGYYDKLKACGVSSSLK